MHAEVQDAGAVWHVRTIMIQLCESPKSGPSEIARVPGGTRNPCFPVAGQVRSSTVHRLHIEFGH